jgi:hypothetical protein
MIRKLFFIATTAILILSVFAGIVSALDTQPGVAGKADAVKANLDNVRAYAAAPQSAGLSYAVDGGDLYAGRPGEWRQVATPAGVIVGAVAVDSSRPGSALHRRRQRTGESTAWMAAATGCACR